MEKRRRVSKTPGRPNQDVDWYGVHVTIGWYSARIIHIAWQEPLACQPHAAARPDSTYGVVLKYIAPECRVIMAAHVDGARILLSLNACFFLRCLGRHQPQCHVPLGTDCPAVPALVLEVRTVPPGRASLSLPRVDVLSVGFPGRCVARHCRQVMAVLVGEGDTRP